MPGALVGYGVGHVVGRKLKKKKSTLDYNRDKQYSLRLSSWILFLKSKTMNKTPIEDFSRHLEKALDELRPALVLQLRNEEIDKQIEDFVKFLKSTPCHTALLNSILEMEFHVKNKFNPKSLAFKLRSFIIPTYHLLKLYYPTLEVVQKIEILLGKQTVRDILENERCISDPLGNSFTPKTMVSESLLLSQLMAVEDYDKPYHQKAFCKIVKGRPASLPDNSSEPPYVRLSFREEKCLDVIKRLYPNQQDDSSLLPLPVSCDMSLSSPIIERKSNPVSFSISGGMFRLNEVAMGFSTPPRVFEGYTNDLIDSEESEEESLIIGQPLILDESGVDSSDDFKEEELKQDEVVINVHPFMQSFEQILAIESEPTGGSDWKQTVNRPETKIYTKTQKNSPLCMVKAFCEVPYPQEVVFKAIWDTSVRRQWDAVFNEFKLIDSQQYHDTLYYMIKTPFGITKRDWVQRRTHLRDCPGPGNITAHFVSIDHPNVPPIKGVIRALTIVSGYVFRSTGPQSSTLTIISQNDIKGLIPKMIVNKVSSKAPADWVKSLYKGCELALSQSS